MARISGVDLPRDKRVDVALAQFVETRVDPAGKATLGVARAEQLRSHHRGQSERDDTGDDHRAREREGEFAEE